MIFLKEFMNTLRFVAWDIVLHEEKAGVIGNLYCVGVWQLQKVIDEGEQSIVQNVFIFMCSNPPFIANDQRTQSVSSKTCPNHYFDLCASECLLNILPIERFSRWTDDPLATWIYTNPYTGLVRPNHFLPVFNCPILVLFCPGQSFCNIFRR